MVAPAAKARVDARVDVSRHGRVLQLLIDNPAQRNAVKREISTAMTRELRLASADDSVGAVVIAGAGAHFCSGGDLTTLHASRVENPPQHHIERVSALNEFIRAIRQCTKPVIAAVEGNAAGAGFSIAFACDMIVAADKAQFVLAYVKIGLSPDGAGTFFLSRSLPPQLAAELAMTGAPVGAARLASLGVVNRLVPAGKALEEGCALAATLASGATNAIARIKHLLNAAQLGTYETQLELERSLMVEALHGDEAGEGIGAFLEKRKARFHPQGPG